MVKQRVMTLAVAAMIVLATALGIWKGLPIGDETTEQMRKAATSYEKFGKESEKISNNLAKYIRDYRTKPTKEDSIEMKYAPVETVAALAATEEIVKAMQRQARALEALAIKFRKITRRN